VLLLAAMIGCIVIAAPSPTAGKRELSNPKLNGITEIKNIDELEEALPLEENPGGIGNA